MLRLDEKPADPEFERLQEKTRARQRRDLERGTQRDRQARKPADIERDYHAHMALQRQGKHA